MKNRSVSELKAMAREQMFGKYGIAIAVFLIVWMAAGSLSMVTSLGVNRFSTTGLLISYGISFIINLILGVVSAGMIYFFLNICRGKKESVSDILWAFSHHPDKVILITLYLTLLNLVVMIPFIGAVCAYLFLGKKIVYILLMTLAIIFAIIAMVYIVTTYAFVFPVFIDHYDASIRDILQEAGSLMRGHKLRYLYMLISFLGWGLLSLLSCGIGYLWVLPYTETTQLFFYMDITGELDAAEVVEDSFEDQNPFENLYR